MVLCGGSKEKHPFKVNGKIESPVVLHLKWQIKCTSKSILLCVLCYYDSDSDQQQNGFVFGTAKLVDVLVVKDKGCQWCGSTGSSRACCSCSSCCGENNSYPKQNLLTLTDQLQIANPGEVLSGCCTCEAAAVPSESSSCSLVVPFEDLGTVLPFHLGDNHHQHSAAFVNRVR